ncbi:hypothetical protein CDO52_04490 [Nocardiopsis gilva YIM 90087]|uniref:Proteinase inhibitor I78 n=1 Tax=Nocardiopsis gilva YIM 90087 TaxID=1235441 RepID=A0A223S241_9ACTN|nr:serine protease inhibitor [Nocardiopsis gilva]ASU82137.1 hypothetical protein CDO52_04490 [Nocardiopsis gilva YIM 90087]
MKRVTVAAFVLASATSLGVGIPAAANAAVTDQGAPAQKSASFCKGKQEWPELAGAPAKMAKEIIERENPYVTAKILPEGSPVTLDFRCDRVWLFHEVDSPQLLLVNVPRVG